MRKGQDNELLVENGTVLGINFGSDLCAEHEWGIKGIKYNLGIDSSKPGIKGRKVTKVPKDNSSTRLFWVEDKKFSFSGFCLMHVDYKTGGLNTHYLERAVRLNGKLLWTAWDEGTFGVFSEDPETIKQIREVYDHLVKKDAIIWIGGGGVFHNAGLCVGIKSRLEEKVAEPWLQADQKRKKVRDYMASTGIEELLKKAGKQYYSLRPEQWKDGKYRFWLNPCEQGVHNYGWYKLKDLKLWAQNKGPIMKR